MERLLHYVWKYKLYGTSSLLITTEGYTIEVIDPGLENGNAGPDFFNAKIKIDGTLWAGSVELHDKASDWLLHCHHLNKAYDNVILHVVGVDDFQPKRTNGESIPQLVLTIPKHVSRNAEWLLYRETLLPCLEFIPQMDSLHVAGWLEALLTERLERKTQDIFRLLELYKEDWNEAFLCYFNS